MRPHLRLFVSFLSLLSPTIADPDPQNAAAGGGAVATTQAVTQAATAGIYESLITVGGTPTVTYVQVTVTFAKTALGTWALGATPGVGTIGLGDISGTIGVTKAKR